MDAESKFFGALLRERKLSAMKGVKPVSFSPAYRDLYDFILNTLRHHGDLPHQDEVIARFPNMVDFTASGGAEVYRRMILENSARLKLEDGIMEGVAEPLEHGRVDEAVAGVQRVAAQLRRDFRRDPGGTMLDFGSNVAEREQAYALRQKADGVVGLPNPLEPITIATGGAQPGDAWAVLARPNMGKAQPVDSRVLTPTGWQYMGLLRVGDELASVDGSESRVLEVHPQGEKVVYKITFSDGRSTEACSEHLWEVHNRDWDNPRLLQTWEVQNLLERTRYKNRIWVELFSGDYGHHEELPLDPWLMGVLLGDGCFASKGPRLSAADEYVQRKAAEALPDGMELVERQRNEWGLVDRAQGQNRVTDALRSLELWGLGSHEKFIPDLYMHANKGDRRSLLMGLLDADGYVSTTKSIRFCSTSLRLAMGVQELTRSLGGVATIREREVPTHWYKGQKRQGKRAFVAGVRLSEPWTVVGVPNRKARLPVEQRKPIRLNFAAIEFSRKTEAQCITVSHPTGLYVTDHFIVTHNSWKLILWAMYLYELRYRVLFVSAETPAQSERPKDRRHKIISGKCIRCYQTSVDPSQQCDAANVARQRLTIRFDALGARVSAWRFLQGCLDFQEMDRVRAFWRATSVPGHYGDLRICSRPYICTLDDLAMEVYEYEPDIVFWDSAYRAAGKEGKRNVEMGYLVEGFKDLMERVQIPGVVSWHFNREVKEKDKNAPQNCAAETDELPRIFDVLIGLFRPPKVFAVHEAIWRFIKTRDGLKPGGFKSRFDVKRCIDFSVLPDPV